ncbi:glycoprotein [Loveridge's garter snake virus 1]|uniref:Glycoprotein n=1 Tax=Loveridge's garter snake virus 1 TaxID=1881951 RepID=A0A077EMR3_9MONO|nr:glycoprotein [Loveridge's garter snake virus 1]AIL50411.1 glycoprotein [Loveridge's garter snake virus 1]
MLPSMCILIGSGMLELVHLVQTSELQALNCDTRSSPALIDLEIRRLCHKTTENVVSCEVSYQNHTVEEVKATLVSCYSYRCTTYWGFFGSYSADKMTFRYTGNATTCNNQTVEEPYICNWYYCCSKAVNTICRCTNNNVTVVIKSAPPYMYCSFGDCSTVTKREIERGLAKLSDGSLLYFNSTIIPPDIVNTSINGSVLCNNKSKLVSFDKFRRSYPLRKWKYNSQSINITCSNDSNICPAKRRKRDLSQVSYALHKIRPILADAWEDCEIMQSLILGMTGSNLFSSSQFLRKWLNRTDIIGYVVGGLGVIWQCSRVNVSFLSWNESTYFPPVSYMDKIMYLNDEDRLQDSTPEAKPGLKRLLLHGSYFLGTVGSGLKPKLVSYDRSTHDYHLDEFDAIFNLTPEVDLISGHETNPINHAFGTQSGLLPYTRSTNLTSTDTGSGWVHIGLPSFTFLNPLGWVRDILSWAAWIGGILYLITLCISLPALINRKRRLGRWS